MALMSDAGPPEPDAMGGETCNIEPKHEKRDESRTRVHLVSQVQP